jgi:hypothetical protein
VDLPEITEVQRFRYAPGYKFVVKVPSDTMLTHEIAREIVVRFVAAADLPAGTPVVVLADDWELTIIAPDEP